MLRITLDIPLEFKKRLEKDPKNKSRTRWSYYVKLNKGRKRGFYRVSKRTFFDLKFDRLDIADIMP